MVDTLSFHIHDSTLGDSVKTIEHLEVKLNQYQYVVLRQYNGY